jgi:hypothetical protein
MADNYQFLAESPGAYLDDCQLTDVQPFAKDKVTAERLWHLTETLTGKAFAL